MGFWGVSPCAPQPDERGGSRPAGRSSQHHGAAAPSSRWTSTRDRGADRAWCHATPDCSNARDRGARARDGFRRRRAHHRTAARARIVSRRASILRTTRDFLDRHHRSRDRCRFVYARGSRRLQYRRCSRYCGSICARRCKKKGAVERRGGGLNGCGRH